MWYSSTTKFSLKQFPTPLSFDAQLTVSCNPTSSHSTYTNLVCWNKGTLTLPVCVRWPFITYDCQENTQKYKVSIYDFM